MLFFVNPGCMKVFVAGVLAGYQWAKSEEHRDR